MATPASFDQFVEDVYHGVHDFSSDQFTVALVAAANTPDAAADAVLTDLTVASLTNCSSPNITTTSSGQTAGQYRAILADLVLTASGGSVGPFRYVVVYNNTPTSPADPLVCFIDYGADTTILDTETFTINFDDTNGLIASIAAS